MKYLSALLLITATLHGSDSAMVKINKRPLTCLNDAPAYCAQLILQLDSLDENLQDVGGWTMTKFLPLPSGQDANICELMHTLHERILGYEDRPIWAIAENTENTDRSGIGLKYCSRAKDSTRFFDQG